MHIMINGNYLSLDNIFVVEDAMPSLTSNDKPDSFMVQYQNGKTISFYLKDTVPINGEYHYTAFYFKDQEAFLNVRREILNILTHHAAKSI